MIFRACARQSSDVWVSGRFGREGRLMWQSWIVSVVLYSIILIALGQIWKKLTKSFFIERSLWRQF